MSDIVLASLAAERDRMFPLIRAFRAAGLSVWSEGDVGAGTDWRRAMSEQLESARCIVVPWTRRSAGDDGELIQEVAAHAKAKGILLPVLLDAVTPPLGFANLRFFDLTKWNGKPRNPSCRAVVAAAQAIASGKRELWPRGERRMLSRVAWMTIVFSVLLSLISFFSDVHELLAPVCGIPGVRSVCAEWGLGGVPTTDEARAWAARTPGDCAALRAYIARFATGNHADEAQRMLLSARVENNERWSSETRRLPLTVRTTAESFAGEQEARADAQMRGRVEAGLICAGYSVGPLRLRAAAAEPRSWRCFRRPGGVVCGFDGQAICEIEVLTVESRETCP